MEQETEELRDALRVGKLCLDNHVKIGVPVEQMATVLNALIRAAEMFMKAKS